MMNKTLIGLLSLLFILGMFSCGEKSEVATTPADLNGFVTEPIEGSMLERVTKKDQDGKVLEEGFMLNGLKEGTWVTYHKTGPHAKTIETYAAGKKNGLELSLTNRGQVEKIANYKGGLMNGYWAEMRFGRPTKEATYVNNLFHGEYKEYHQNNKLARLVQYQNGQIHGKLQTFDDQENMTTDYNYENGEKISGGIVNQ